MAFEANRKRIHSVDSEFSTENYVQKPNFQCGKLKCGHRFYLGPRDNIIRCPECGYRILYKTRTMNHITYKT